MLNHIHLIVNASVKNPPTNEEEIKCWLKKVVDVAGMKLVLGPFAHYCTAKGNEGLAAICAIETSHASIHIWDKEDVPYIRFDLYSCSSFNANEVINLIKDFQPIFCESVLIDRNTSIKIISESSKRFE